MPLPLFAYGTLRDQDLLAAVLGHPLDGLTIVPATAPGCRAVFYPGRVYPALIAGDASAEGALVNGLDERDWAVLDAFEGDEYERRTIPVSARGGGGEAEVYWPVVAIAPNAPNWSFTDWLRNHKSSVLVSDGEAAAQLRARLVSRAPPEIPD